MSEALFAALYTLYSTSNTFKTATAGRYEYGVAPEAWTDNFAVVQGLDVQEDDCFRESVDDVYFQINVFSITRAGCFDLLNKCISLFNGKILTITGYYNSRIARNSQVLPLWNEESNLYQATAEFTIKLQESP